MKKFEKLELVKLQDEELKKVIGGVDEMVKPMYGVVIPLYGIVRPLYGIVRPLYGIVKPMYGVVIPLYGVQVVDDTVTNGG